MHYISLYILSRDNNVEKLSSSFTKNQLNKSSSRCKECTNSDPRVQAQLEIMNGGRRKSKEDKARGGDADTTSSTDDYAATETAPQHRMSRVLCRDDVVGSGETADFGSKVKVHYIGRLEKNGKIFDSSKKPFRFKIGGGTVIKGWDEGVVGMRVGGRRRLKIPPHLAYGSRGAPPTIPPNATLLFDISLLQVK